MGILNEMKWTPGVVRRDIETIWLYNQLINMLPHRLNCQVYELDHSQNAVGSWYSNVQNICSSIELSDLLNEQKPLPIAEVKSKLIVMYEATLGEAIARKPKLVTYQHLSQTADIPGYLNANLPKYKCSLICQLKLGILPIPVESGRFQHLHRSERICLMCKNGVEDEIHFTLNCVCLSGVRDKWLNKIPKLKFLLSDMDKLKHLCSMPYRFGGMLQDLFQAWEKLINS